jgi:hypothetical protein
MAFTRLSDLLIAVSAVLDQVAPDEIIERLKSVFSRTGWHSRKRLVVRPNDRPPMSIRSGVRETGIGLLVCNQRSDLIGELATD